MRSARSDNSSYLVARAGRKQVALDLGQVIEVMRPLPVATLATAPAFVLGIAVVRGAPVPVVDACALLGEGRAAAPSARFVSLRLGSRRAALLVDGVLGVRTVQGADLEVMPPLLRAAADGVAGAVSALDQELLVVLGAARLVPEAVWHAVEAAERS